MPHVVGSVEDLATLSRLDNDILLNELKARYLQDKIYTNIGDILVAVNPYRDVGLYKPKIGADYHNKPRNELPPHIFGVAEAAYQSMLGSHGLLARNQCILISGESGAGKTESTKFLIKQLVDICKGNTQLEQQILQVNPLLEAFGNAQTVMNHNSSRFGKYILLKFHHGKILGAKISEYLLEKSRVVRQADDEENFHIFYYVLAGLSDKERSSFGLGQAIEYRYLSDGGRCMKEKGGALQQQFDELVNAMDMVGFDDQEQADMFTILAAVLNIGNIDIASDDSGHATIANGCKSTSLLSKLIGVDKGELEDCLTCSITHTKGEEIVRHYSADQAKDSRDAVAKAIYGRLFSWIVHKINTLLAPEAIEDASKVQELGILDIFGFEQLATNSFEQACINLANEQLQYFFNQHIFSLEQEEYKREGVDWKEIKYPDNTGVLDLFLGKPIGIMALLDEESLFPKGSDLSYVDKLTSKFDHDTHYTKSPQAKSGTFTILHYAGKVEYTVDGWLEKNRDTLPPGVTEMLKRSGNKLLSQIHKGKLTRTGTLALQPTKLSKKSSRKKIQMAAQEAKERKLTVGAQFKNSLSVLMTRMTNAQPVFVRCIKPNGKQVPKQFDDKIVMSQLLYTGMLETTKIRREGFAVRPSFEEFVDKFRLCIAQPKLPPSANGCAKILKAAKMEGWKIGKTKVFLKYWHIDQLDALMVKMGRQVTHMQRAVRGFLGRQRAKKLRAEAARKAEEAKRRREEEEAARRAAQLAGQLDQTVLQSRPPAPSPSMRSTMSYLKPTATDPQARAYTELQDSPSGTTDDSGSEDDFKQVKSSAALYGPVGTKQASVRWFQETQAVKLQDKGGGQFEEWFHGIITRRDAEELLDVKPVGCFLVRVSESRFGYSLSFRVAARCRHYMIDQLPSGKFTIIGEHRVHKSLHDLANYYQKNKLSNWDGLLSVACGQKAGQCDYSELLEDAYRVYADLPDEDPSPGGYAEPYHPYLEVGYNHALSVRRPVPQYSRRRTVSRNAPPPPQAHPRPPPPPKAPLKAPLKISADTLPPPLPDRNYSLVRGNRTSKPLPAPTEAYERMVNNQMDQNSVGRDMKGMCTSRPKIPPPGLPPRKS